MAAAHNDNRRHILVRYSVITILIVGFSIAISYKLFSTTVIHADDWNRKAMVEMQHVDTILPERGEILACDGSILATNLRFYTVRLDFRAEKFMENRYRVALDSIADSLALHFPRRTRDEWFAYMQKPLNTAPDKRARSFPVVSNISYADLQILRTFPFFCIGNPNRNGMTVESTLRRRKPYGDMASRSIGGVGQTASCKEVHGISGLEKALDSLLYGSPGIAKKIPLTKNIVNWTDVPAKPGFSIRTTIDINLQDIVEHELERVLDSCSADWGCAILMEVATGDIKAISNLERNKAGTDYIEALNYAVVGFEPGSVVKPISMMIALEDGLVSNLEEMIPIGASWAYAGGRPITDSHFNASLRVREVIEQSSNIGMARIITRGYDKNPKAFVERLRGIGFLDPMNTGIAGERTPYFNPNPGRVDLSRMCYGYASQIPPIYTLSIYNAIANNGRYVRPRLVGSLLSEGIDSAIPVSYIRDRICSEANARKMQYMLKQVVWGPHGTGRSLKNDKVALAGKTGTCYSVDPATRQYNTARKRLAFCGFFPADAPKYSCMVLTFYPKRNMFGAASTSGQVMRNIALKMYSRGMLDNASDYAEGASATGRAMLYGSYDTKRHGAIRQATGIRQEVHPARPRRMPKGTVPSVRGLGAREAVVALEAAGFNVNMRGSGYVRSQLPAEGSQAARGTTVTLAMAP
ncbi:MAG: penicillin-binding protein [Muribaculaceae bacterium]|nr:penicillin-binding protein [Bacteroidales bacterium]MDY4810626.1 penicillin-binding protein [Muribaculaceae bacterium]